MQYLLIIVGLVLLTVSVVQYLKYKALGSWIYAKAEILTIDLEEQIYKDSSFILTYFIPKIKYNYSVDGDKYLSEVIAVDKYWTMLRDKGRAKKMVRRISALDVAYVNPKNHSEAILIKDISPKRKSHILALFISGFIVVSLGLFFVVYLN